MALFQVFRGNKSGLTETILDGAMYVLSDSEELLFDVSESQRIKISDFIDVNNYDDLPLVPLENKFYYDKDATKLYRYNGSDWKAIGISDYDELTSKPSINNVELTGNITLDQLGVQAAGDYALKSDLEGVVFIADLESGEVEVNASNAGYLDNKNASYYQNIAATYNAIVDYVSNVYNLTLTDTSVEVTPSFFSIRFIAPGDFVEGSTFTLNGVSYTPTNAAFVEDQVVLAHFNKNNNTCYFASGSGGASSASDLTIDSIEGLTATTGQEAFAELASKSAANAEAISALQEKDTEIESRINNLVTAAFQMGDTAPEVTSIFWIDTTSSPAILKYYNGSEWTGVVGVWG